MVPNRVRGRGEGRSAPLRLGPGVAVSYAAAASRGCAPRPGVPRLCRPLASHPRCPDGRVSRRAPAIAARRCGLSEASVADVRLAVSEAVTNVVVHAYSAQQPGDVGAAAYSADGVLSITISDQGMGMAPRVDSPGAGLGLPIIASMASTMDVRSDGAGTHVQSVPLPPCAGCVARCRPGGWPGQAARAWRTSSGTSNTSRGFETKASAPRTWQAASLRSLDVVRPRALPPGAAVAAPAAPESH